MSEREILEKEFVVEPPDRLKPVGYSPSGANTSLRALRVAGL